MIRPIGAAAALLVALVGAPPSLAAQIAPPDGVKVIVAADDLAAIAEVLRRGGALVADRGGYRVFSLPRSGRRSLALPEGVRVREDFDRIRLRRRTITSAGGVSRSRTLAVAAAARRLKIVQLAAPPSESDLAAIAASGARIVHYLPQNAYLLWTDDVAQAKTLGARVLADPMFRYFDSYQASDALSPGLDGHLADSAAVEVTVQLFNYGHGVESEVKQIMASADALLSGPSKVVSGRYINLRVALAGTKLAAISEIASVVNIEPYVRPYRLGERQGQILAGNLDGLLQRPSAPGYLGWLAAHGFSTLPSDYPIVAVVDDGVDDGTTTPSTDEFYQLGDPLNPSRLVFAVVPPGSLASGPQGPDGHGHINASIIGGYNGATGAAVEDSAGYNYGLGISPYGRLANVRIFTPDFDVGAGDASMVDDYYARGARISSNSWGVDVLGGYTVDSQLYDALTRDAQSSVAGNQEMLFIFAAGNAGPSAGSVGAPASAKNVIAVGASETSNPDAASGDGCGDALGDGDDARDMANFSSRGPTQDGRVRPDIVAPGTFIQGNAAQPTFNGSGVCGAVSNDGVAPGDDALFPLGSIYTWSSGTSHSTPAIAGVASLTREFLSRVYGATSPSPALIKAYTIHSGRHLSGTGANENLPGGNQGFGLADLGLAFDTSAPRLLEDQTTIFANSGDSLVISGQVPDASQPVRIALVWTDAPGSTVGDAFVNDLDLVFEIGANTYLGNNFTAGVSHSGGVADTRNNAESIFLAAGHSGLATIRVNATTIAGDGVPGNSDASDQDFAIVAYNFALALPAGTIALDGGAYSCSDTVGIAVADSDLTGSGSVVVAASVSGGDAESVVLAETPAGSGVFSATLPVSAGAVVLGDAILQVADGETLTVTYNDADDGSGTAVVVQDSAVADCVVPLVSGVGVSAITGNSADVVFSSDEAATGSVRYGTSCAALTQTASGVSGATSHVVALTGLSPLTTYFVIADATDAAGNSGSDDNGGACYSFTTLDLVDYFTEQFVVGPDLANHMLMFTPSGSMSFYSACSSSAVAFPTDPSGGTVLTLTDDDSIPVALSGGAQVSLYGVSYSSVFIGSNGYLTFGSPDIDFDETLAEHFAIARVAGLYDDLNPAAGGTVSYKQLSDRFVVSYEAIAELGLSSSNDFQIEMFFDGRIRITHLALEANDGIIGLSAGAGLPSDFIPSNLSAYGSCGGGALCGTVPAVGCVTALRSQLKVADRPTDSKDRFSVKWIKGGATTRADFGNPLATAGYAVCVYDSSAGSDSLAAEMAIAAGQGWKARSTSFKYKDKFGVNAGITRVQLKSGVAGKAKIIIKGAGANLTNPVPVGGGRFFVADPRVTLQVVNDETPVCWTSEFSAAGVKKNTAVDFKAKAP